MSAHYNIVYSYFDAFKQLDWKTMQNCYTEEAIFLDAVMGGLYGEEIKAMWQMLLSRNKGIAITVKNMEFDGEEVINSAGIAGYYCKVHWDAVYTFTPTGKKVHNKIISNIRVENDKIAEQFDQFGFYRWARQAFGLTGALLGWTPFFRKKVMNKARNNLKNYIEEYYMKNKA